METVLDKISQVNDTLRKSGQGVMFTTGVQYLEDINGLIKAIREYDNFTGAKIPTVSMTLVRWFGRERKFSGRLIITISR